MATTADVLNRSLERKTRKPSFYINTPSDFYGHWINPPHPYFTFCRGQVLYALDWGCSCWIHLEDPLESPHMGNTFLFFFSAQMSLPLWNIHHCPLPLFFPPTIYPNTTQLSPLSALSSLHIYHELNILTCLCISLTYHPRLNSSKSWMFLTLKTGLCLISSVVLIKFLFNE